MKAEMIAGHRSWSQTGKSQVLSPANFKDPRIAPAEMMEPVNL